MPLGADDGDTLGVTPRKQSLPAPPFLRPYPTARQTELIGRGGSPSRGRTWRLGASIAKVLQQLLGSHEQIPAEEWVARGFSFSRFLAPTVPVPATLNSVTQKQYSFLFNSAAAIATATGSVITTGRADRILAVRNLSLTTIVTGGNGAGALSWSISTPGGIATKQVFKCPAAEASVTPKQANIGVAFFPGPIVLMPGDEIDINNGYSGAGVAGDTLQTIATWDMLEFPLGYNAWEC